MSGQGPGAGILETSQINKVKFPDGSKVINGFRVHELLGKGTFAKVKMCEKESTREKFAMKIFNKCQLRKQREFVKDEVTGGMKVRTSLDKAYNEVKVMRRVAHQNCVRLYAAFDEARLDGKLYLVLEYAARGCTMEADPESCTYRARTGSGVVPEALAAPWICDALCGLDHLHSVFIAHRDVKPQNLMVDGDGRVKIGDFSVAIEMGADYSVYGTEGSYCFFSPEMCRTPYHGHDGRLADVWALGVTLWAFLYGCVPFWNKDLLPLLDGIAEANYKLPTGSSVSEGGEAFLRRVLSSEPGARPLPAELLQDPWTRGDASARTSLFV